jgi:hypothetical protein
MRPAAIARAPQYIRGKEQPLDCADRMVADLQRQDASANPSTDLWESFDLRGRPESASLSKEVGDSAETAYANEMYVTPKMAHRWKEIHWWLIDARCGKVTYGPDTPKWAHCDDSKTPDGEPWPEWTGKEPYDHSSNRAREEARGEDGAGVNSTRLRGAGGHYGWRTHQHRRRHGHVTLIHTHPHECATPHGRGDTGP